jgi:hypothetical protein
VPGWPPGWPRIISARFMRIAIIAPEKAPQCRDDRDHLALGRAGLDAILHRDLGREQQSSEPNRSLRYGGGHGLSTPDGFETPRR